MRLSDAQIAQAAAGAGFSGNALVTAVAIAIAESGGDAGNTTGDGGTSWGLWQIHWTVHPQFNRAQLTDPNYNAAAAWQLSGGGSTWQPWTTYKTGAYRSYLSRAQNAAAQVGYVAAFPGATAGMDASGNAGADTSQNDVLNLDAIIKANAPGGGGVDLALVAVGVGLAVLLIFTLSD